MCVWKCVWVCVCMCVYECVCVSVYECVCAWECVTPPLRVTLVHVMTVPSPYKKEEGTLYFLFISGSNPFWGKYPLHPSIHFFFKVLKNFLQEKRNTPFDSFIPKIFTINWTLVL